MPEPASEQIPSYPASARYFNPSLGSASTNTVNLQSNRLWVVVRQ